VRGIYYRFRADGSKEWSYYDPRLGRAVGGCQSRQEAIDKRAMAQLAKSAGLPPPDTKTRIADLAEEVREAKRSRLRPASFRNWQYALDRIVLKEVGDLKPAQLTPDRIARLIRDLEERALSRDTSNLIAAADELGRRPRARFDYSPLIQLLALTGLRVSEALALRWADVDLFAGVLNIRHSLGRDGTLGQTKTTAGERVVPLRPGLVDLLVRLKPLDASEEGFVFAGRRGKPLGYWNIRNRGFQRALEEAGLDGNGLTIHDLRHAAASLYIASGLTAVDVAAVTRPLRREHHAPHLCPPVRPLRRGCEGQGGTGVGRLARGPPLISSINRDARASGLAFDALPRWAPPWKRGKFVASPARSRASLAGSNVLQKPADEAVSGPERLPSTPLPWRCSTN
jgi:integrase